MPRGVFIHAMSESKPIDILPKKEVHEAEPGKSPETPNEESAEKTDGKRPDEFQKAKGDFSENVRQAARGTPEFGKKLSEYASRAGSSAESLFETTLKEVMSGEGKEVPVLAKGKKASFAPKSESAWRTFFANVSLRGSGEKPATREGASVVEALFRGVFKEQAKQKGVILVTDLKFKSGGREVAEKFARLVLEEPAAVRLEKLSPGEPLEREHFIEGEELNYTALAPVLEEGDEKGGAELLKQLRSDLNPIASARLEKSLVEERLRKAVDSPAKFLTSMALLADEEREREGRKFPFPFWYSGTRREERGVGRPRLWITVTFGVGLVLAVLIGYLLWRGF